MKKLLSLLLCILFIIGLAACTDKDSTPAVSETNPTGAAENIPIEENVFEEIEKPENTVNIESLSIAEPRFGMCQAVVKYDKLNVDFPDISSQLVRLKESEDNETFLANGTATSNYFGRIFGFTFDSTENSADFGVSSKISGKDGYIIVEKGESDTIVTVLIETKNLQSMYDELKVLENAIGSNLFEDAKIIDAMNKLTNQYNFENENSTDYTMLNVDVEDLSSTGLNHINYCIEALIDGFRVRCDFRLSNTYYEDIKNGTFAY